MRNASLFLLSFIFLAACTGCLRSGRLPRNEGENAPKPMDSYGATSSDLQDGYLIPSSDLHDTLLLYKKTPCFGVCPVFTLVVKMDGEVYFTGVKNTLLEGTQSTNWNSEQLEVIDRKMRELDIYNAPKSFDNPSVTDLPSMYIGYTKGDHLKTVKCRYQYPNGYKDLSAWLDEQIKTSTWKSLTNNK
jgi:hypothetical protein